MLKRFPWGHYGFEVGDEAASGQEAIAKLDSNGADLLVTDVRLSDMEGLDFLALLNQREEKPCLILLSSYNDFEYAQQGIGLGVFDYMTKPFSTDAFGQMLRRANIYLRKTHADTDAPGRPVTADLHMEGLLEGRTKELERLLLEGNRAFIEQAGQLEHALAGMSRERREPFLVRVLEQLYRSFDEAFPWVKNIESRSLSGAEALRLDGSHNFFQQQAKDLFSLIDAYDLAKPDSLLYAICHIVQENVEKELSLHNVAARLCISPDYAGRVFKRRTGVNFVSFLTRTKMEHGKKLLAEGELRNYEISTLLGYSNPDYFRQLFKAHTGMTPTEYRNICRRRIFR